MKPDPLIDEIRKVRHEMSSEINHDPKRLMEYYADIQERYKDRLVNYGDKAKMPLPSPIDESLISSAEKLFLHLDVEESK